MLRPDKRPAAVKLYNSISIFGGRERLSFDKLIRKARRKAGLSNFGSDFNETALQILIHSINTEANLHPFGMLMIREKLISQLENRLWVRHWLNKYPQILEQELLPIILITGLQRTGTTKLQRLLSAVNGVRPLWCYEAMYPAPVGSEHEVFKRLSKTRRNEKAVKWLSPTFHKIHPIYHDRPEEDVLLLDLYFMSSSAEAIMHVPSYARWLKSQDHKPAYAYEKKLLLLLQWQKTGSHWILKSPHHLEYMTEISEVFHKVQFIWTHRSLEDCIPSFLSMLYHSRRLFSNDVQIAEIKDHWLSKIERMLDKGLEFIKMHPEKTTHLSYQELLKNESLIIDKLAIKMNLGKLKIKPINVVNKNTYRSGHQYTIQDWGLDKKSIRRLYQNYYNRFAEI